MSKKIPSVKKRNIKINVIFMIGIILYVLLVILISLRQEIITIASIQEICNRPAYHISYQGDYHFDEYLKTGAKDPDELKDFIFGHFFYGIGDLVYEDHGCSAFYATTPEGDLILARDYDTKPRSIPAVVEANPDNSFQTISVINLEHCQWNKNTYQGNFIGKINAIASVYLPMDGMNEYGLSVALCTANGSLAAKDDEKITLFDYTMIRLLLDKAKNVEEAINLMKEYNISFQAAYPSHYILGDASGNSVIVEYVNNEMHVLPKQGDYQIISNFILYDNSRLIGFGSDRYQAYDETLSKSKGIISTDDALKLLEDNAIPGNAQWSVVYNLTKKTMTISFSPDYDQVYTYSID